MCSFSVHPYTTGVILTPENAWQIYLLQTPIRDRVGCASGPAESYVVPIASGQAYLDLSALALQLIILFILLIGAPLLALRKKIPTKASMVGIISGVLYGIFLIVASLNHIGKEIIFESIGMSTFILLAIGIAILRRETK